MSFDTKKIKVTSFLNKEKELLWTHIVTARFNAFSSTINIKSEFDVIKVHQHLKGLPQFLERLENKTGITKKDIKMP